MTAAEYSKLISTGQPAEGRVHGVLRGGHVVGGEFVAHAGGHGIIRAPLSEVSELRIHKAA